MLLGSRIAALVVFVGIAAMVLFAAVDRGRVGAPSAMLASDGTTSNTRFIVTRTPATSPLHLGDHVEINDPRELAAFEYHALALGSTLRVHRIMPLPQATIDIPVVAPSASGYVNLGSSALIIAIEAMFIGIAALIAVRGRSSGSLSLAWLFALILLLPNATTPAWPSSLILAWAIFSNGASAMIAFMCATDFATRFAADASLRWTSRFRRISLGLGLLAIALNLSDSFEFYFLPTTSAAFNDAALAALLAQAMFFLIALCVAFTTAPTAERQRVSWVAMSLGIGVAGFVISLLAAFAGVTEPARDYPLLLLIAMPLGCAYAILRYRLLDIGFVVNRATVFGITSVLVLGALAVVDYGLSKLLGSWLVHNGTYVQLGVALAIGMATRPAHARVDRLVDHLFFRQRHETEHALRRFAQDVAYIDDRGAVLRQTVEIVASAARLRCALLLTSTDGLSVAAASEAADEPKTVDRNDAAIVRLRATREAVDLHGVQTAIAGDFAFPMFARNRMLGVLVCGGKSDGVTAYAPDELDAISAVAHASGLALDLLRVEALERELSELRRELPLRRFALE